MVSLSQAGLHERATHYAAEQLAAWQAARTAPLIDPVRLDVYSLLAGDVRPLFQRAADAGAPLDWRRSFALYLWYLLCPNDCHSECWCSCEVLGCSCGIFVREILKAVQSMLTQHKSTVTAHPGHLLASNQTGRFK